MEYLTFREPGFAFTKPCKTEAKSNEVSLSWHKWRAIRLCSRLRILCSFRTSGMLANQMDYLTFREPEFAFTKPCKNKSKFNAFSLSWLKWRVIRLCSRLRILCSFRTSGMLANPMDYLTFREPGFAFTKPCETKQHPMYFRSVGMNGERFAFVLGSGFYAVRAPQEC